MPGNAYPHLIFATDADTLPRADLEGLVDQVLAHREPTVEHGAIQVVVRLGDYAFTFWYDDDSEGLGERYASYAPTIKRRRISRCSTMIDFSGGADDDRRFADAADALMRALAQRSGVYVFSEEAKGFVGMDEDDPFADAPVAAPAAPVQPEPVPAESARPEHSQPLEPAATLPAFEDEAHEEPTLVTPAEQDPTRPAQPFEPEPEPEPVQQPAPQPAGPAQPAQPAQRDAPAERPAEQPAASDRPVAPTPEPTDTSEDAQEPTEAAATDEDITHTPAGEEEKQQGGFFKRLFGRRR